MIEETLMSYLSGALAVPVQAELQADPPARIVTLNGSGVQRSNRIDTATIVLTSYAPSALEAARLNAAVMAAMDEATDLDAVSAASLVTSYPVPEPAMHRHRHQCIYNITHY